MCGVGWWRGDEVGVAILLSREWGRMFLATYGGRGLSPTTGSLRPKSILSLVDFGNTN